MILSIFGAQHFGCSLLSTMMYRRYKVDVKEFPPPALSTWEGFDLHNLGDQWQFCKSLGSPKTDILNPTKKGKIKYIFQTSRCFRVQNARNFGVLCKVLPFRERIHITGKVKSSSSSSSSGWWFWIFFIFIPTHQLVTRHLQQWLKIRNGYVILPWLWVKNPHHFLVGGFRYFYFHPYLGKIPSLTNIFQGGWNHQLVLVSKILGFPGLEVTWGLLPGTEREFLEVSPQLPVVLRVVATRGAFAAICNLGLWEIGRWFEIFGWMVVIHIVLGGCSGCCIFFWVGGNLKNENETKQNLS